MATIKYTIKFFSPWHCGSGLAAGAALDLLVVKDRNGLPYMPGKTMKGLVKEWAEKIIALHSLVCDKVLNDAFGEEAKSQGCMYFSNAELDKSEAIVIVKNKMQEYMYTALSSTAIDEKGISIDHSLRRIEAVIPCEISGFIYNVPEGMKDLLSLCLTAIKHVGSKRNRGMGRCDILIDSID